MGNQETDIVKTAIAMYSSNISSLAKFYEEALDLNVVESGDGYICLENSGIEVNILQMNRKEAKKIHVEQKFTIREETPIKCSFLVSTFDQVYKAITKYGGSIKSEVEAWDWRGTIHLDGYDPEGNVVQYRVKKVTH